MRKREKKVRRSESGSGRQQHPYPHSSGGSMVVLLIMLQVTTMLEVDYTTNLTNWACYKLQLG